MRDTTSNSLFKERRYDEAAQRLKEGLEDEGDGDDQLLYLMDLGLVLHTSGQYSESNKYFLKADDIADIKDYTQLSDEAATLLTSENIKQYKGEDFEKVMINVYLALNFIMQEQYEDALVEVRRVNTKLYRMINEGKRKYKLNAFARYLSAVIYEARGDYDDAYIDYKQALELQPDYPPLKDDLLRMAAMLRRAEDVELWSKRWNLKPADMERARASDPKKGKGELVVIFQNGISPIKQPNPEFNSLPRFYPRPNPVSGATVIVNHEKKADTGVLFDIEQTAIQNLDDNYAGMVAKKIAGMVAKEAAGEAVGQATDSPVAGVLTKIFFYASDQADLRSWNFLPRDLQIARVVLPPGDYEVKLSPNGAQELGAQKVSVKAGKKVFLNYRYVP